MLVLNLFSNEWYEQELFQALHEFWVLLLLILWWFFPWPWVASSILSSAQLKTQGPPFAELQSSHSVQLSSSICPANSNRLVLPWLAVLSFELRGTTRLHLSSFPCATVWKFFRQQSEGSSHLFLVSWSLSIVAWCSVSWKPLFYIFCLFFFLIIQIEGFLWLQLCRNWKWELMNWKT